MPEVSENFAFLVKEFPKGADSATLAERHTYGLFDLDVGVPTDAYELETAVEDEFLVPPRVEQEV